MNVLRSILLAASCIPALSAHAAPVTYAIDASHTKVYWETRHFGTSTHRGRFDTVEGSIVLDRDKANGEVSVSIATGSVSSGVPALDNVLRSGRFLSTDAYPTAYFIAKQLFFDGDHLNSLRGEFTLRGVSKPLSLNASNFACRVDAMLKREVCGGDFEADILRSDYGSTFGLPFVEDKVRLLISIEGVRQ